MPFKIALSLLYKESMTLLCCILFIANIAYCIDFSSDFNIDQNFLNEMKKNFGEESEPIKQDLIKPPINYPEKITNTAPTSNNNPIKKVDKASKEANTEKQSGIQEIQNLQVLPSNSSSILASPELPAEAPAEQNNFNNTKALINQLKSPQNDNMTQIAVPQAGNIGSPVTPRSAPETSQALDQKPDNSLIEMPNLTAPKIPEPKQVTAPKLSPPEPVLPTLDPAQTKALPLNDSSSSIQKPNVVPHINTESTLTVPLAPVTSGSPANTSSQANLLQATTPSKISSLPQTGAAPKTPEEVKTPMPPTAAPKPQKVFTPQTLSPAKPAPSQKLSALKASSKPEIKKPAPKKDDSTQRIEASKLSNKGRAQTKSTKKATKGNSKQQLKCIPRPKAPTKKVNGKKDSLKNTASKIELPPLMSFEEADNLGLSPRSVYDYRDQYLPPNINKTEYSENNKHLPKAFFHSEYSRLLFAAVNKDDIGAIRALLKKGADINTVSSNYGYTPLMQAVLKKKIDVARYLITRGANFNQQANDGKTALHLAAIINDAEMFKMLIAAGTNTYITDIADKRAFQYVTSAKMASQLALYYDNMNEALLSCAELGILGCVKFAIERGADVNTSDKNRNTALILAAQNGDEAIINWLLYKGARPGKINIKGNTAALLARRHGYTDIADSLETAEIQEEIAGYKPEDIIMAKSGFTSMPEETTPRMKPIIREPKKNISPHKPKKLTIRRYCD
ncbi:MAG: Ankyrin repeat [Candidatus Midichloria mitochondrii]